MNYDYYLFDLDNCLVEIPNISIYFDELLIETLKHFKVKDIPDFDERCKIWGSGKGYIDVLKEWGVSAHQEFWGVFDLKDFEQRKPLIRAGKIKAFDDVVPTLDKLMDTGKKMGMISNTPDYIVEYQLNHFNLKKYFEMVFGLGEDQTICKPGPTGINMTLDFFLEKSKPQEMKTIESIKEKSIMVGDSPVDIIAAHRAGIKSCLIIRIKDRDLNKIKNWEYQPHYIIYHLSELLEI